MPKHTDTISDESAIPLLDEVFDALGVCEDSLKTFLVASGLRPSTPSLGTPCIFLNKLDAQGGPIPGAQYRLVLLEDFN